MTDRGTAAPLSQAMARPHRTRLRHSPTEPPHLHEGLQETLCQGPEGTPILWLLMLGLRLLQQGINVWAEAGGGTKQHQTCRGEQWGRAASTSRVQGKGPGLSSTGCGCSQPPRVKTGGGQGHLWCPVRSAAPGRLFSCRQLPPPGLHPSAPPAGPPGPSAGSNASPGAGSARAGLSTAPGALPSPPSTTASSPGRITHCEAQEGTEWPRARRERGERVGDGLRRQQVGSAVFTL